MRDVLSLDLRQFVPHREPMILIDRITLLKEDYLESEVTIREDSMFLRDGAVPAWVGVEYMAQTCAAFQGLEAHQRGEPPRAGFLLASRHYHSKVSGFELGSKLRVRVTQVHREAGGLSVVEGEITELESGTQLVHATLTVYEVANLTEFLAGERGKR